VWWCKAITASLSSGWGEERRALSGARRRSQRGGEAVDRDDEDAGLDALAPTLAHDAQDGQRAVAAPATSPLGQPCGGVAHAGEVVRGVRAGLGLDREAEAGGGDGDAVDVSVARPGQRVAESPAFCLERHEGAPYLVLGPRAEASACG
jgi:hypothetical protein